MRYRRKLHYLLHRMDTGFPGWPVTRPRTKRRALNQFKALARAGCPVELEAWVYHRGGWYATTTVANSPIVTDNSSWGAEKIAERLRNARFELRRVGKSASRAELSPKDLFCLVRDCRLLPGKDLGPPEGVIGRFMGIPIKSGDGPLSTVCDSDGHLHTI